jgi:hypothetical protein
MSQIHRNMSFTKSKQTAASTTQKITVDKDSRMVITRPSQKDQEGYLFRHHSKRRNRPIVTLTVSHPGPRALSSAGRRSRATVAGSRDQGREPADRRYMCISDCPLLLMAASPDVHSGHF